MNKHYLQKKKRNSKNLNKLRIQRLDNICDNKMYNRKRKIKYFSYTIIIFLISLILIWIYSLII